MHGLANVKFIYACSHCELRKLSVSVYSGLRTNCCVLTSLEYYEVLFRFQRALFSQSCYYGDGNTGWRTDGVGIYIPDGGTSHWL
jgi:hypothetical protein